MSKYLFIISIVLMAISASAQQDHTIGALPSFSMSNTLGERFKLISGIESRQRFYDTRRDPSGDYQYVLTDIANFVRYKSSAYTSLALGYTLRIQGEDIIHRISQQFAYAQGLPIGRLSHRIATDQTWESESILTVRGRYRIVYERPLVGDQIDPREPYLKLGQESLFILEEGDPSLELRLVPRLGLEFGKRSKMEWGLDYRLKSPFALKKRNDLYFTITYYTTLDKKKVKK